MYEGVPGGRSKRRSHAWKRPSIDGCHVAAERTTDPKGGSFGVVSVACAGPDDPVPQHSCRSPTAPHPFAIEAQHAFCTAVIADAETQVAETTTAKATRITQTHG